MKKTVMMFGMIVMAIVTLVFSADASYEDRPYEESERIRIIDNVVYSLDEDGKSYYVEDYFATHKAAEKATEINIVSEIDGIPVTAISIWEKYGFPIDAGIESLPGVKKITVPEGITEICVGAFSSLDGVESIELPSSVKKIRHRAFYKMDSLKKVNIPRKVTVIESDTFMGCKKLESVKLEGKIKTIEAYAFYGCNSLEKISLPKSLVYIGGGAFSKTGLTSVTLPAGVRHLGDEDEGPVFSDCERLTKVVFKDSDAEFLNIAMYSFSGCTSLKKVYLPKSVKRIIISEFAFEGCTKLTNVYNRGNITEILMGAFYNCKSMKSFVISKNVTNIEEEAFYGCLKLKKVTFDNTKKAPVIGSKAFSKVAKEIDFFAANKKVAKSLRTNLKVSGMKNPDVYYITYTKLK